MIFSILTRAVSISTLYGFMFAVLLKVKHQRYGAAEPSYSLSEEAPRGVPPLSRM